MRSKCEIASRAASALIEKLKVESSTWEAEGRDAWTALKRLGSNNLPDGDEIIIARCLHKEMPKLKERLKTEKLGLGELCLRAGLGNEGEYSKELYRMTLSPEQEPSQVGLRKSATKYRQFIAAIGQATRESTSSLANRLLLGTTLHPSDVKDWTEIEQVQVTLQTMVDSVDREFGLYGQFMETARLKAAQIKEGGNCFWPHYELDPDYYPMDEDEIRSYQSDLARAADARFAFWRHPVARRRSEQPWWLAGVGSDCLQDTEFFFVPHAYLGSIEYANLPDHNGDSLGHIKDLDSLAENIRRCNEEYGWEPTDAWDEKTEQPIGQTSSGWEWQEHGWIVIYPTPDNHRLMPMLYIPCEEGGAFLLPLDAGNLKFLKKNAYWVGRNDVSTVFERIKQLIGHLPGTSAVLLDGFRRTAPWLSKNPIFKARDLQQNEQVLLQEFCKKLWGNT